MCLHKDVDCHRVSFGMGNEIPHPWVSVSHCLSKIAIPAVTLEQAMYTEFAKLYTVVQRLYACFSLLQGNLMLHNYLVLPARAAALLSVSYVAV